MANAKTSELPLVTSIGVTDTLIMLDTTLVGGTSRTVQITAIDFFSSGVSISGQSLALTQNTLFSSSSGTYFRLQGGTKAWNFDPTGTYSTWTELKVLNVSVTTTITFDSSGSAQEMPSGTMGTFIFDGLEWN